MNVKMGRWERIPDIISIIAFSCGIININKIRIFLEYMIKRVYYLTSNTDLLIYISAFNICFHKL